MIFQAPHVKAEENPRKKEADQPKKWMFRGNNIFYFSDISANNR